MMLRSCGTGNNDGSQRHNEGNWNVTTESTLNDMTLPLIIGLRDEELNV